MLAQQLYWYFLRDENQYQAVNCKSIDCNTHSSCFIASAALTFSPPTLYLACRLDVYFFPFLPLWGSRECIAGGGRNIGFLQSLNLVWCCVIIFYNDGSSYFDGYFGCSLLSDLCCGDWHGSAGFAEGKDLYRRLLYMAVWPWKHDKIMDTKYYYIKTQAVLGYSPSLRRHGGSKSPE